jgi:hydrogenase-4 membrane subunit HyfE
MEKAFEKAEDLAGSVKEYINTRIEYVKLTTAEKSATLIANVAAGLLLAGIFVFFLVFAGISLSIVLGQWIGQLWAGFLIVAFFYLLVGLLVWVARGSIIRLPVMNALIQQLFKKDEEDQE